MSQSQWRGVIAEYADRLRFSATDSVVSLGEGGTALVAAPQLSRRLGNEVHIKVEGNNPTGSFKDRGMTVAISRAKTAGSRVVLCASTGNTSASAAAYAAAAQMRCAVLVPEGKIAFGKLAQAVVHGADILQVNGNFDTCLEIAQQLSTQYPVTLVNSVNPHRIAGQQTAAWEIRERLGRTPDIHALPVGNAGNITAYWQGYQADVADGLASTLPQMFGVQASGAAPIVTGSIVEHPETVATAIRIGNPASWPQALTALQDSKGRIVSVSDEQILMAQRLLAREEGIFVEPASAAPIAGLLAAAEDGTLLPRQTIVVTVTGHGLKDPQWALKRPDGQDIAPITTVADVTAAAQALELG